MAVDVNSVANSKMFSKFSNIGMATRVVTMVIRGQLIRYHGYPPRCYGNRSRCHANITKFTKNFTICNTINIDSHITMIVILTDQLI